MENTKLTRKTAIEQLAKVQKSTRYSDSLRADIAAALSDSNVTMEVLRDLLKTARDENRALLKGETPVVESVEVTPNDDKGAEVKPLKKTKKPVKKAEVKEEADMLQESMFSKREYSVATYFPKTIKDTVVGTLNRADDLKDFADVRKALEKGDTLILTGYWTMRQLKKYDYAGCYEVDVPREAFPNNLDLMQVVYIREKSDHLFAASLYTEAFYHMRPHDFDLVEDVNPADGSKFKVRASNGMEFEVYRLKA